MTCFYFGAWAKDRVGHFLYAPGGSSSRRDEARLPFKARILDAALLPDGTDQVEGRVHLALINGWTVLSFWDRSADSRYSSNSAFVIEGTWTVLGGLEYARAQFPEVFARITFPLVPAV